MAIRTLIDGDRVSVKSQLEPDLYSAAVQAHARKQVIAVTGDLKRHGQRWHLLNPRDLTPIGTPDDDEAEAI